MAVTNTSRNAWLYGANNLSRPTNMTIAGWVNCSVAPLSTTTGVVMSVGNTQGYPNDAGNIECKWDSKDTNIHSAVFHNVNTNYAHVSMGTYAPNTWYHFAITRTLTLGQLYQNGVSQGTVALTNQAYSSVLWYFSVLAGRGTMGSDPASGSVCMAAWWDTILSQSEITSLALGFSPRLVRPQNLRDYFPLIANGVNVTKRSSTVGSLSGGVLQYGAITNPAVMC